MKLILDEWIVREVIDTLYMARTTFLGITGLDSPQEVAKKSANETAITRRISKAIDIIQQSEQSSLPNDLEEAANEYEKKHTYQRYDGGGFTPEYDATLAEAVIFGAKWQKEQDEKGLSEKIAAAYQLGLADKEKQMMKEAVCYIAQPDITATGNILIPFIRIGYTALSRYGIKVGDKVRIIIVREDEK